MAKSKAKEIGVSEAPVRAKDVKFKIKVSGRHAAVRADFLTLVNSTSGRAADFEALMDTVETLTAFIEARGADRIERQKTIGKAAQERMRTSAKAALNAGIDEQAQRTKEVKAVLMSAGKLSKALKAQVAKL